MLNKDYWLFWMEVNEEESVKERVSITVLENKFNFIRKGDYANMIMEVELKRKEIWLTIIAYALNENANKEKNMKETENDHEVEMLMRRN